MAVKRSAPGDVEGWIAGLGPPASEVARALRRLILEAVPDLGEEVKWGRPCYSTDGFVAYIGKGRGHVTFGLFQGAKLQDPEGLLSGSGKVVRSLRLRDAGEIPAEAIQRWVREAAALNREG